MFRDLFRVVFSIGYGSLLRPASFPNSLGLGYSLHEGFHTFEQMQMFFILKLQELTYVWLKTNQCTGYQARNKCFYLVHLFCERSHVVLIR